MNCLCFFFGRHFITDSRGWNSLFRVHFWSIDESLDEHSGCLETRGKIIKKLTTKFWMSYPRLKNRLLYGVEGWKIFVSGLVWFPPLVSQESEKPIKWGTIHIKKLRTAQISEIIEKWKSTEIIHKKSTKKPHLN